VLGGERAQEGTALVVSGGSASGDGGNGVFTYYLASGLRGMADRDEDGVVTTAELTAFVTAAVPQSTGGAQHPDRVSAAGEDAAELFRYRAGGKAVARAAAPAADAPGAPQAASNGRGPLPDFDAFVKKYDLHCFGPLETVKSPAERDLGEGRRLRLNGYNAELALPKADKRAVIGVLGAIKDYGGDTEKNVREFVEWFRTEGVEAIVVNGDIAYDELDIRGNLKIVAESGIPVFALIGNSETVGAFNGAIETLATDRANVVNLNLVRRVELDGATIVSLPGYFNKTFIHETGGCLYRDPQLADSRRLIDEAKSPVVFISHGPPKGDGKQALDFATGAGNVGDDSMLALLKEKQVAFGAFGHILEAGGAITDTDATTRLKEGEWHEHLWLNAGQVSALPWEMNDGTVGAGMAAVLEIDGHKARVRFRKKTAPK
jgi:Icc-related predicted phosphoesterase